MDDFGPEILKVNVVSSSGCKLKRQSLWKELPRARQPTTIRKTAQVMAMQVGESCSYIIKPYIPKSSKIVTSEESLYMTKKHIWYNYLFPGFEGKYEYNDEKHYPYIFSTYLSNRGINVDPDTNIDIFIRYVRNEFFTLIKYCLPQDLISVANWIADNVLRINNEEERYIVKSKYINIIKNKTETI